MEHGQTVGNPAAARMVPNDLSSHSAQQIRFMGIISKSGEAEGGLNPIVLAYPWT